MGELENLIYTALWKINASKDRLSNPRVRERSDALVKEIKVIFDRYQSGSTSFDSEKIIESAERAFNASYDRKANHWCPPTCKSS